MTVPNVPGPFPSGPLDIDEPVSQSVGCVRDLPARPVRCAHIRDFRIPVTLSGRGFDAATIHRETLTPHVPVQDLLLLDDSSVREASSGLARASPLASDADASSKTCAGEGIVPTARGSTLPQCRALRRVQRTP